MAQENYYEILGISRNASGEEIKQAYRRLVKIYHPDMNPDIPDAEEHLVSIVTAYQTLINKRKRAEYDSKMEQFCPELRHINIADVSESSDYPVYVSGVAQRQEHARRMMINWLAAASVVLLAIGLCFSDLGEMIYWGQRAVSPVIYAGDAHIVQDPASVFATGDSDEDRWYLWLRRLDYQLFYGEMGTSSEAYAKASEKALHQGREKAAKNYALLALRVDPGSSAALHAARVAGIDTAHNK